MPPGLTLTGGPGNETLSGGPLDDLIEGGGGNDRLSGGEGADTLLGGEGTDSLFGGEGDDVLRVTDADGTGAEWFHGGAGTDTLAVGAGIVDLSDLWIQFDGVEAISFDAPGAALWLNAREVDSASELRDVHVAGATGARIVVIAGVDRSVDLSRWTFAAWSGGGGNLVELRGDGDSELLEGSTRDDLILGEAGNDTLFGSGGADTLDGGAGSDRIASDGQGGTYLGGSGNDTLISGGGPETMEGGTGIDLLDLTAHAVGLRVDLATGDAGAVAGGGLSQVFYSGFEDARLGAGDDSVIGSAGANALEGRAGNDTLIGGGGADRIKGGEGNDSLVSGGAGVFWGEAGDDTLVSALGVETMHGGTGKDLIDHGAFAAGLTFDMSTGRTSTAHELFTGFEDAVMGAGADSVLGTAGANWIRGGSGADTLEGRGGTDTLEGEAGGDRLVASTGGGSYLGGTGDDTLVSGGGAETLDGGAGMDLLDRSALGGSTALDLATGVGLDLGAGGVALPGAWRGFEHVLMGSGDDSVEGTAADEWLRGGAGADTLSGAGGTDTLEGGDGDDVIVSGPGGGTFDGGAGSDLLDLTARTVATSLDLDSGTARDPISGATLAGQAATGFEHVLMGAGGDAVAGTGTANAISGGAGSDTLRGAGGDDTLTGGDGADVFVFGREDTGRTVIEDFDPGEDRFLIDWTGAVPFVRTVGGVTVLDLGQGGTVELRGVARDAVTRDHVSYVMAETRAVSAGHAPIQVAFSRTYEDPVVLASVTSAMEAAPVSVRLDGLSGTGVTLRLQEPGNLDGLHAPEDVTLMVVERGAWETSEGLRFAAGAFETGRAAEAGFEAVDFGATAFGGEVSVQAQVQTTRGADWVVARMDGRDADGAWIALQAAEDAPAPPVESVGWLAVSHGLGSWDGRAVQVGTTGDVVDDASRPIDLIGFGAAPALLAQVVTYDGADPVQARVSAVRADGFDVHAEEETVADSEVNHTDEEVDFLAVAGSGLLGARAGHGPIAEYGSISVAGAWTEVSLDGRFVNPVVFATAKTAAAPGPVTVTFGEIAGDGFEMRLDVPSDLGPPPAEDVSFLVVEAGRWRLDDGSVLQAGLFETGGPGTAQSGDIDHGGAFATRPALLSQVQTANGGTFAVTRHGDADADGATIRIQEEEGSNTSLRPVETVGWLAFEVGSGGGVEAGRTAKAVDDDGHSHVFAQGFATEPILIAQLSSFAGSNPASVRITGLGASGFDVRAQEDTTKDTEVTHPGETVDYLALTGGGGTLHGAALLPAAAQAAPVIAATGRAQAGDDEVRISFGHSFFDPVVLAMPPSESDAGVAVLRVSDVTADGFSVRMQAPNADDPAHGLEDFTWLAVESGDWALSDGTRLRAGTLESDKLTGKGFETVAFSDPFAAAPAVLAQTQTDAGSDWVTTRLRNVGASGFDVAMQEEETLNGGGHKTETIGWLAIDTGRGDWDGAAFEAGTTGDALTHVAHRTAFSAAFDVAPGLLAGLTSFDGADPAALRVTGLDGTGVSLRVMEDTSRDAETSHTTETAAYLALDATGLLTGAAWA